MGLLDTIYRIYLYVLLPLVALVFLVIFFPIGILFGLCWLYLVYKHREPQRKALEAQKAAEQQLRVNAEMKKRGL
jgi:hypothetical protein